MTIADIKHKFYFVLLFAQQFNKFPPTIKADKNQYLDLFKYIKQCDIKKLREEESPIPTELFPLIDLIRENYKSTTVKIHNYYTDY